MTWLGVSPALVPSLILIPTAKEEVGEYETSLYLEASSGSEGNTLSPQTVRVEATDTTESFSGRVSLGGGKQMGQMLRLGDLVDIALRCYDTDFVVEGGGGGGGRGRSDKGSGSEGGQSEEESGYEQGKRWSKVTK
jgi:hypothetical protein